MHVTLPESSSAATCGGHKDAFAVARASGNSMRTPLSIERAIAQLRGAPLQRASTCNVRIAFGAAPFANTSVHA